MKMFLVSLALFTLFVIPSTASAQRKNNDLENQLATYLGPFEIISISDFERVNGTRDYLASITFKGPNGRLIAATVTASSIEVVDDQNTTIDEASDVGDGTPDPVHTVSFSFNTDLIDPMSWRLISRPAKFITANYKAVQVEIHCPSEERGKYTP